MKHDELVEQAKKAITAVFGDMSVDKSTTIESLKEIRDDLNVLIDAAEND